MPYKDRNILLSTKKTRTSNTRIERRERAYAFLGGRCVQCGSDENLEFDHIDPSTKVTNVTRMMTHSIKNFMTELQKCQLLCHVCHLDKTYQRRGIACASIA